MPPLRLAAWLFLGGAAVFFLLGFGVIPFKPSVVQTGSGPLAERLRAVDTHVFQCRWIMAVFSIAAVVTAVAFATLASGLQEGAGRFYALAAAVLYGIGAVLFLARLAAGATLTVAAARDTAVAGTVPAYFPPLDAWAERLYDVYMLLAFPAVALAGAALLRAGAVPAWAGWTSVAFGAFLALSYPLKFVLDFWIADLPLWIHVWGLYAGAVLLHFAR